MNLLEHLKIKIKKVNEKKVILSLDINEIHHQPYGFLHGGISATLIETACSIGANYHLNGKYTVGVDLQVSHFSKIKAGILEVTAIPEKIGKILHFWKAEIVSNEKKISSGKCTLIVKDIKNI